MKKRVIAIIMAAMIAFSFAACGINAQSQSELNYKTVYDIAVDNGYTGSLEQLTAALKGDSAYKIACDNGYVGTETEWLLTLVGASGKDGKDGIAPHIGENGNWFVGETDSGVRAQGPKGESAYEIAVENGYKGTETEWLVTLAGAGADGLSAYQIAVINGFEGTETEWLMSLVGQKGDKGDDGLSAYEIYKKHYGYEGTEKEWIDDLINGRLKDNQEQDMPETLTEELLNRIRQDYFLKFGYVFWFDRFYGLYSGAAVFFIPGDDCVIKTVTISGVEFSYNYGWMIWVWKNGKFYSLEDVETIFDNGILTQNDIEKLGVLHAEANLAEELMTYKSLANSEIKAYADSKGWENYSGENFTLMWEIIGRCGDAIDAATCRAEVDAAVLSAKQAIDAVPIDEFVPLDEYLLDMLRHEYFIQFGQEFRFERYYGFHNGAAVFFLLNTTAAYKTVRISGVTFSYSSGWTILVWKWGRFYDLEDTETIFDERILTQTDIERIGAIHAEANRDESFARYKANSRMQIEIYAKNKGQENYSDENWAVILEITSNCVAAIDAAKDSAAVYSALTWAMYRIDIIPRATPVEDLEKYKAAARAEVEFYAESKGRENYSEKDWEDMEYYIWAGIALINVSTNKSGVDSAVKAAKEGMDTVPLKGNEMPEPEEMDEELLNRIKQDYLRQFRYELFFTRFYGLYNGAAVFFVPGDAAVVKTVKISGIVFSYGSAWTIWVWKNGKFYNLEDIDAIFDERVLTQNDVEKLGVIHADANIAENLAIYKISAKAQLEAYAKNKGQDNYTEENWVVIEGLVAHGKEKVEAAEDKTGVDFAVAATKEAIDAVPLMGEEPPDFEPLNKETLNTIKQDYIRQYQYKRPGATIDDLYIVEYIILYDECIAMSTNWDMYTATGPGMIVVGGVKITFYGCYIKIWYKGCFYEIEDAYNQNILNQKDLERIASREGAIRPDIEFDRYKDAAKSQIKTYAQKKGTENYTEENWLILQEIVATGLLMVNGAENKTEVDVAVADTKLALDAVPKIEQVIEDHLDEETLNIIKQDYLQQFGHEFFFTRFYGLYDGAAVFFIFNPSPLTVMKTKVISGVTFSYTSDWTILVWKDGKFYNLEDIYTIFGAHILTQEDIEKIGAIHAAAGYR